MNSSLTLTRARATLALVRRFEPLNAFPFHLVQMKPIRFKIESHYGLNRAYPLDQEAILVCRLSKTKTLLPGDIGTVAALGYEPVNQYGVKIDPKELY